MLRPLPKRSEPERTLQPSALSRAMSLTAGAALAGSPRTDDASGTPGLGAAFREAHHKAHASGAHAAGASQPPPPLVGAWRGGGIAIVVTVTGTAIPHMCTFAGREKRTRGVGGQQPTLEAPAPARGKGKAHVCAGRRDVAVVSVGQQLG